MDHTCGKLFQIKEVFLCQIGKVTLIVYYLIIFISCRFMKAALLVILVSFELAQFILLLNLLCFIFPRHTWGGVEKFKLGFVAIVSEAPQKTKASKGKKVPLKLDNQKCHVDYNDSNVFDDIKMVPGMTMPLVCILAVQDGTKIVIYNKDGTIKFVNIPKGHLFIMSGDCLHGGFSHVTTNARLHWYLEAPDLVTSDKNQVL